MSQVIDIPLPDIGDFHDVDVIEVLVKPGDRVAKDASLLTLESDKATMEIPAPVAGIVRELLVKVGSKISPGTPIVRLETAEAVSSSAPAATEPVASTPVASAPVASAPAVPEPPRVAASPAIVAHPAVQTERRATPRGLAPHASPGVRRFAHSLGVDLARVTGTGPKGRILREDIETFVAQVMKGVVPAQGAFAVGAPQPEIDFTQFGPIDQQPLSRIRRLSGAHLHHCWVSIPHVTHFDEADITDLEEFRKTRQAEVAERGIKLTFLPFVLKSCVTALRRFPQFNASLAPGGEQLIFKRYYHLGVAVDTPDGLVVPVIRDVDQKGLVELAQELSEVSQRARDKRLTPADLKGGSFSISSLGGLGGIGFTPIVNAPEVAILGVSRAAMQPVWKDGLFVPRLMLPFSVSYDHRVIDGADAARFARFLADAMADIRALLL